MKNSFFRRIYFAFYSRVRLFLLSLKDLRTFCYKNKFEPFFGRFWGRVYFKTSGVDSEYYLSEVYFYNFLEKKLNDFSLANFFEHKGYLSLILGKECTPICIVNAISGVLYNQSDEVVHFHSLESILIGSGYTSFVIKRSIGTGGGKSVEVGDASSIIKFAETYHEANYDFVIQPKLKQHSSLSKFNKSSLNTIRVLTLAQNGDIDAVSTVFRMGNGGFIDNSAAGGISIGVNEQGKLNSFAIDHDFNKYYSHPHSNISFSEDSIIPFFSEICSLVKEKHKLLKSYGVVSWDVTVDEMGHILIIEYNVVWSEINFHQANNGPIFEKHKDFIMSLR